MEPKAPKQHGSQKRERQGRAVCFVNEAEKAAIEAKAEKAGLSVSGYMRALIFGKDTPQPRGAKRPVVEKELLVRVLGELGKIGSNLNQIAHVANQGRGVNHPALAQLVAEVVAMRQEVKAALGREAEEPTTNPPMVAAQPMEALPPVPSTVAMPPTQGQPERGKVSLSPEPQPASTPSLFGKLFGGGKR